MHIYNVRTLHTLYSSTLGIAWGGSAFRTTLGLAEAWGSRSCYGLALPTHDRPQPAKRVGGDKGEKLDRSGATDYRVKVARMNYLGQDKRDIANTVKELSTDISSPSTEGMVKLKND